MGCTILYRGEQNEKAEPIIDWVVSHALKTGMLSEQINPGTLEIISPAPLTWSHAELVSTLLDRIQSDDEPANRGEPIKIKRKDNKNGCRSSYFYDLRAFNFVTAETLFGLCGMLRVYAQLGRTYAKKSSQW